MVAGLGRYERAVIRRRIDGSGPLAVADDGKWVDRGEPGRRRYAPRDRVQGQRHGRHSAQKLPDARSHVLVGPSVGQPSMGIDAAASDKFPK
jgi:hypothetical protein